MRRLVMRIVELRPFFEEVASRTQVKVYRPGHDMASTMLMATVVAAGFVSTRSGSSGDRHVVRNRLDVSIMVIVIVIEFQVHELRREVACHHRRKHHTMRWTMRPWEHDDTTEQTTVNALGNVARVVMERPCAPHLISDGEVVDPVLSRTDLVGTAAIGALGAKGP
jgi:hypothetical protein